MARTARQEQLEPPVLVVAMDSFLPMPLTVHALTITVSVETMVALGIQEAMEATADRAETAGTVALLPTRFSMGTPVIISITRKEEPGAPEGKAEAVVLVEMEAMEQTVEMGSPAAVA